MSRMASNGDGGRSIRPGWGGGGAIRPDRLRAARAGVPRGRPRRAAAPVAGLIRAVALGLATLAATLAQAQTESGARAAAEDGRLTIVAEGRVLARPDMAMLRFGVERMAETAEDALAEMSEAAADLLDTLEAAGVAPEDRQTGALRLQPRWSHEEGRPPEIEGYVAATAVTARLRALDAVGEVIDAAVSAGANRLDGLSFGLADPEAVRDAARRAAVAEARRRAALYAEAAGVTLGRLVALDEIGAAAPVARMMEGEMLSARAASVPIAEGETAVTVQLRLVYAIPP